MRNAFIQNKVKNYESSPLEGGVCNSGFKYIVDSGGTFTAAIIANDVMKVCKARMIVIANSNKYGSGIIINPKGAMNDGKFELVILKNLDLIVLVKIISGNMPLNSEDVEIISTHKATITTNIPVCFQIDGEYSGEKTELNITILPKQIKVAIP